MYPKKYSFILTLDIIHLQDVDPFGFGLQHTLIHHH